MVIVVVWVRSSSRNCFGNFTFLWYINDLPDKVNSNFKLYADDVLLYRTIHSSVDCGILQENLDILCCIITPHYNTCSTWFLDIRIYQLVCRKTPQIIKKVWYKSMIKPVLEYSNTVWFPYTCTKEKLSLFKEEQQGLLLCLCYSRIILGVISSIFWRIILEYLEVYKNIARYY